MENTILQENTQRPVDISPNNVQQEKDFLDIKIKVPMKRKVKIIIAVSITLTVLACVGIAVGLYFHFRPTSDHIMTNMIQTPDGNLILSTKFNFAQNNINDDDINQNFTITFASFNQDAQSTSSQSERRLLATESNFPSNVLVTLDWIDETSGISMIFLNNQLYKIVVKLDQLSYMQPDWGRILQQQQPNIQYDDETQTYSGKDLFDVFRQQLWHNLADLFGQNYDYSNIVLQDQKYYGLQYDPTTFTLGNIVDQDSRRMLSKKHDHDYHPSHPSYASHPAASHPPVHQNPKHPSQHHTYSDAHHRSYISPSYHPVYHPPKEHSDDDKNPDDTKHHKDPKPDTPISSSPLSHLSDYAHDLSHAVKRVATPVVHAVKKYGPTVLKYGAITACAAADAIAQGSGSQQGIKNMYHDKSVKTAAEIAAQGVGVGILEHGPAYVSIPTKIISGGCMKNPPYFHCTRQGLESSAKSVLIDAVTHDAIQTGLSLLE